MRSHVITPSEANRPTNSEPGILWVLSGKLRPAGKMCHVLDDIAVDSAVSWQDTHDSEMVVNIANLTSVETALVQLPKPVHLLSMKAGMGSRIFLWKPQLDQTVITRQVRELDSNRASDVWNLKASAMLSTMSPHFFRRACFGSGLHHYC